jgi:hypothetical protein
MNAKAGSTEREYSPRDQRISALPAYRGRGSGPQRETGSMRPNSSPPQRSRRKSAAAHETLARRTALPGSCWSSPRVFVEVWEAGMSAGRLHGVTRHRHSGRHH